MFATMKTRTKVLVGFSLAIAVAATVGVVGYVGISTLSGHVEEVGMVRLPSVQSLLDIKVGAEQIKNAQRTLLNFGVDTATRQRQEGNVKKAREQYETAWKTYEALPQTPAEAELWKQFVPAWQQWRSDNNEFFRLSLEADEMIMKSPGAKNETFSLPNALQGCADQCFAVTQAFQTQIHEWKNILLRGNNAADYDKHFAAFRECETAVQAGLQRLQPMVADVGLDPQAVAGAAKAHADLSAEYRAALKDFDKSKSNASVMVDKQVRGLDRPVTAMLIALRASISEKQTKLRDLDGRMAAQLTNVCRMSMTRANDLLDKLVTINADESDEAVKKAHAAGSAAVWMIVTAIGIGSVVLLALGIFTARNIARMLTNVINETARLSDDAVNGKLQTRGNSDLVSREFRPILTGFNATLDAVVGPLNVTANCLDRISKGDIPEKIADNYNGDFNQIKNSLNRCIETINGLIAEGSTLAKAATDGELDTRADETRFQGKFRDIIHGMNNMLKGFVTPIRDIAITLKLVGKKDLSQTVDTQYPGIYGLLRNDVNLAITNMRSAIEQINESASQFTEGSRTIAESAKVLRKVRNPERQRRADVGLDRGAFPLRQRRQGERQRIDQGGREGQPTGRARRQGGAAVDCVDGADSHQFAADQRDHPGDFGDRQPNQPSGPERGDRSRPGRRARHGFCRRGRRGAQVGRAVEPGRPRNLVADQGIDAAGGRGGAVECPDGPVATADHQGIRRDGGEDRRNRDGNDGTGRQCPRSVEGDSRRLRGDRASGGGKRADGFQQPATRRPGRDPSRSGERVPHKWQQFLAKEGSARVSIADDRAAGATRTVPALQIPNNTKGDIQMATATMEQRDVKSTFTDVNGTMQLVSFTLAKELYGVEITKVREIILITDITRIPETPAFVKGLINLRSTVIPVIDLRARFGLPEGELTDESRIMVVQACGKTIGIVVDAVSEVLRVTQEHIAPPPPTVAGLGREYLMGLVKLDERLLILLDIDKIFNEEEMLAMRNTATG